MEQWEQSREQCGSNAGCPFHPLSSLKNLTTDLAGAWKGGGGSAREAGRGKMGGGAPESSVGATKGAREAREGCDFGA